MPVYELYEKLRDAKGVNDREVAVAAGLNPSMLYDWKAGRYTPKLDKIMKLAAYFGVKLEDLIA